jgi:hypothetical protein
MSHPAEPTNLHAILRTRLLTAAGIGRSFSDMPTLEQIAGTQWSREFERLQRHRLIMGAFRYGCMISQGTFQFDNIQSAVERAKLYLRTGNLEHLPDIANLAMLEFDQATRRGGTLTAVDDGVHTRQSY